MDFVVLRKRRCIDSIAKAWYTKNVKFSSETSVFSTGGDSPRAIS